MVFILLKELHFEFIVELILSKNQRLEAQAKFTIKIKNILNICF